MEGNGGFRLIDVSSENDSLISPHASSSARNSHQFSEDDTLHITLQKRDKGQPWSSPIQGQGQLDPLVVDLEQQRLMLQRFQEHQ